LAGCAVENVNGDGFFVVHGKGFVGTNGGSGEKGECDGKGKSQGANHEFFLTLVIGAAVNRKRFLMPKVW
jgi:hypothetical protein